MRFVGSQDNGRELIVEVSPSNGGEPVLLLVPRSFLDDEVGDDTSEAERRGYLESHSRELQSVADAVAQGGGMIRKPFDKIVPYRN